MKRFAFVVSLFVFLFSFAGRAQTIQALIDEGALVMYLDFRAGHSLDLSGQGNDGTPIASSYWAGGGLQFAPAGYAAIADAAELQLTEGALVILGEFQKQNQWDGLITKRDPGGTNWQWRLTATQMELYDGTNTRTLNASVVGHRYLAINMENGVQAEGFVDGLSIGLFNNTSAISVDNAPARVGNYSGSTDDSSPIHAALIVNRNLTATEHATLYAELVNLTWPKKPTTVAKASTGDQLFADWRMENAGVGDWTAGNLATLTKQINRALNGDQVLRVAYNAVNLPYAYQPALTVVGNWYRISGWARGDGASGFLPGIYKYGWGYAWQGTNAVTWQHFDVTVEATVDTRSLLLASDATAAGWVEFDDVDMREVSTPETQFKTDWHTGVSEANVVAGYIEGTQWQRNTGTWEVTTGTVEGQRTKVLECAGAGIAYLDNRLFMGDPTQDAQGTWIIWFNKTDIGVMSFSFIMDAAGANGYYVNLSATEAISLEEIPAAITHFASAAAYFTPAAWHKITITRRWWGGLFTVYLDDILVVAAAGTNPFQDETHLTSEIFSIDADVGDAISIGDLTGDYCTSKQHSVITP